MAHLQVTSEQMMKEQHIRGVVNFGKLSAVRVEKKHNCI